MTHLQIHKSPVELNMTDFEIKGEPIVDQIRQIKDISVIFHDQKAFDKLDPETEAYKVQMWFPVAEGTEGGLAFGRTIILPGKVGDEYFMTKGHFHAKSDRAEFYWGVKGKGMLILMDRNRNTWAEEVFPGSLHYIGSDIAHRLANTGREELIVGACWPSDAGHNYEEIVVNGFSARLVEIGGTPFLINY